jgi:hypothetical protein
LIDSFRAFCCSFDTTLVLCRNIENWELDVGPVVALWGEKVDWMVGQVSD